MSCHSEINCVIIGVTLQHHVLVGSFDL